MLTVQLPDLIAAQGQKMELKQRWTSAQSVLHDDSIYWTALWVNEVRPNYCNFCRHWTESQPALMLLMEIMLCFQKHLMDFVINGLHLRIGSLPFTFTNSSGTTALFGHCYLHLGLVLRPEKAIPFVGSIASWIDMIWLMNFQLSLKGNQTKGTTTAVGKGLELFNRPDSPNDSMVAMQRVGDWR